MEKNKQQWRKTYQYHNPNTGLIEHICEETGMVVLIQKSMRDDLLGNNKDTMPYTEINGVRTRIERGVGLEKRGIMVTKRWTYTKVLAELIAQRIAEGETLVDICKSKKTAGEPVMPPYFIVAKWRNDHPEFNDLIEQAFKDRSEIFHGRAIEEAEKSDEDNATAQKVIVDTMRWASAIDDPARFGSKTKISAEGQGNIVFVINTGIKREAISEPIKEAEKIVEDLDVTPKQISE